MHKGFAGAISFSLLSVVACAALSSGAHHRHALSMETSRSFAPAASYQQASYVLTQSASAPLSAEDTQALYEEKCSLCHGLTKEGKPPVFPTLIGVTSKYSDAEIAKQIHSGKGRMPAFPSLSEDEVQALVKYLKPQPASAAPATPPSMALLHAPAIFGE